MYVHVYLYIYMFIWWDYLPSITSTNQNKVQKSFKTYYTQLKTCLDPFWWFQLVSTHTKYMRIEIIIPNGIEIHAPNFQSN